MESASVGKPKDDRTATSRLSFRQTREFTSQDWSCPRSLVHILFCDLRGEPCLGAGATAQIEKEGTNGRSRIPAFGRSAGVFPLGPAA
jgi:hypothetical protein